MPSQSTLAGSSEPEAPDTINTLVTEVTATFFNKLFEGANVKKNLSFYTRLGAIASQIVTFFSSFALAYQLVSQTTGATRFMLYVTPISSLTGICLDLFAMLFDMGVLKGMYESLEQLTSAVTSNVSTLVGTLIHYITEQKLLLQEADLERQELLKHFCGGGDNKVSSNAISPTQYIGLATNILLMCLVGASSLFGWKITEINQFLRLRYQTVAAAKDLKELVVDTLSAMGLCDITGRASIVKDVEGVLELAHDLKLYPLEDFVLDPSKFASLISTLKNIKDIQKRTLTLKEGDKSLQNFMIKLDKDYCHLLSIYKDVEKILSDSERQNCIGVILEGDGGVGKSHLAKHLLKQWGKTMGYGESIYDLSRGSSKRFNKPYAFQSLGIMNEFGAQRAEDLDYLGDVNKILSSDPFGLESASEDLKYQPCKLKVVVFTSNKDRYDFTKVISEPSNIAMMSRFIRVQVRDPNYEADRNSPQTHRKPDYSHLECQILKPCTTKAITKLSDCWNVCGAQLSPKDLEAHIIPILAHHEKAHIDNVLEGVTENEKLREALIRRKEQLEGIVSAAPTIELNFGTNNSFKTFHGTSGNKKPIANASEPLVFHFAGPPGVGKSVRALATAQRLRNAYGMKVQIWKKDIVFDTTSSSVYIFNDYPFHDENKCVEYINLVDNMADTSMVIITSNHPFKEEKVIPTWTEWFLNGMQSWWYNDIIKPATNLDSTSFWAQQSLKVPGLIRRIGCPIRFEALQYVPRPSQNYAFINEIGLPTTIPPSEEADLTLHCCNVYTSMLRNGNSMRVIEGSPPIQDFDVEIEMFDFEKCYPYLQSQYGLFKLRQGVSEGKLTINPGIHTKVQHLRIGDWLMPDVPEETDLLGLATCYCHRLNIVCPSLTVKFKCQEKTIGFVDGILYVPTGKPDIITINGGLMLIDRSYFPPSKFSQYYLDPTMYVQLDHHEKFFELELAREFYELHKDKLPLYVEAIKLASSSKYWTNKFHKAIEFIISPTGSKILGAIFAITCIVGLGMLCRKLFKKAQIASPNSAGSSLYEQYPNLSGAEIAQLRERASKRVLESNWVKDPVSKNALIASLECKNTMDPFFALSETFPPEVQQYLMSARPNAVPPTFENSKMESAFTSAVKNISKNLVKFSGKMNCYGMFLKRDLCVLPLHAVDLQDVKNNKIFWAPSEAASVVSYEVKIVAYTSKKDICLVRALDCPNKKDITNLLPKTVSTTYSVTAAYVRPFVKTEVCWGVAHYNPVKAVPLSDEDQFHPFDYVHFDQVMFGARAIYQIGDCGLPLIGLIDNQAVLLGFHIALNTNDEGWFSCLHLADIKHLDEPSKNATFSQCAVVGFEEHLDVPSWNKVLTVLEPKNPFSQHKEIPVLGTYNTGFSISPGTDKQCLHFSDPENPLHFPLETAPAPTRYSMLCAEAKELLPKLDNGKPSPLLAQVKKYFTGYPFQPKIQFFEHAVAMEGELFRIYFGTNNKPLRLHEVINGILGSSLKHLVMSTSAGPSMKINHKINFKEPLFVKTQETPPVYGIRTSTPAGQKLCEDYNAIIDCWSAGKATTVVIKDNPKVEILDAEDVRVGKIRQFCELDLALNMALRKYFGSVFDKMAVTSNETPWKVAWNPYFMPHHIVAVENDKYDVFCIDVKRMDKNLPVEFTGILCSLTCSTYAEPCPIDFKAIAQTMSQAIHAQGNTFYTQRGGNHSGSALTTPLNTITCHICMLYVFIKKFFGKYNRLPNLREITLYMTYSGMGDDVRVAFNSTFGITFQDIEEGFKECGFEVVLNKNTKEHTRLGELCSRVFLQQEDTGIVYGALKKKSILKTIHWVKKSKLHLFPQIAGIAIFEAALWDEAFFKKVVEDASKIAKRNGIDPLAIPINTYKEYRRNLDAYILGQSNTPIVTSIGNGIFESILPDKPPAETDSTKILKWHVEHPNLSKQLTETCTYSKAASQWIVTISAGRSSCVGSGSLYSIARGQAYSKLCNEQLPDLGVCTN